MIFKKLFKAIIILILINYCVTASLESDPLQSTKIISTTREEPIISVTTEKFHRKQRQSRCIRCYEEGQGAESEQRYGNRYSDDGGRFNRNRYYPSYPSKRINYDDNHSWYNQNDRYDRNEDKPRYYENRYPDRYSNSNRYSERDRFTADRYYDRYPVSGIRNDDRYNSRTYDQYDIRSPIDRNRYDSRQELYNNRGYGYDQGQDYRGRFNERERPDDRGRPGNYYNQRNYEYDPYERHSFRDFDYDSRNYRPGDGNHRDKGYLPLPGHDYANNDSPSRFYNNNPNYLPSHSPSQMSHHPPYLPNSQSPPRPPVQSQNSSLSSNHDTSPDYQNTRLQPDKNSNNDYAGDWSYTNDRNKAGYNTEKDSSPYGGRSRPLTGSYLFDRKSNSPIDLENKNDGINNTPEKNENATPIQTGNDKKSDENSNTNN